MNQSLTETAQEIKTQDKKAYPGRTAKWDKPMWLSAKSEESCYELLSQVGLLQHYPACLFTHYEEVARFFNIEKAMWEAFRRYIQNMQRKYELGEMFPTVPCMPFVARIKEHAAKANVPCKDAIDVAGNYYFSIDDDPQHMVKFGNPRCRTVRIISMRGVIMLALYAEKNPRFATQVTHRITQICRETGFDQIQPPRPEQLPEKTSEISASAESPKLDPAQTLTQMFKAVLTLLTKESEERGAEKLIQKLKEEGKL